MEAAGICLCRLVILLLLLLLQVGHLAVVVVAEVGPLVVLRGYTRVSINIGAFSVAALNFLI